MTEPEIIINGKKLTDAQAMVVRVACTSFAADLAANGLGDDERGRRLAEAYTARVREVLGFIAPPRRLGVPLDEIAQIQREDGDE